MKESLAEKRKYEHVDTVIFDLGGVLLHWDPRSHLKKYIKDPGVVNLFMERIFLSPDWNDLDRRTISLEEGAELFRRRVAPHGELFDVSWAGIFDVLSPYEENLPVLKKLQDRGYQMLILSNFIEEAYHHVRRKYDFFSVFHGGVISYEIQALKPEPEIYDTLIQRYDLVPERSFFIDDRPENVEGARARNLQALQYRSEKPLEEHLGFLLPE